MDVEDVDTYVQDVIHHVELMKNKYPHLPCILIGHSMVHCIYMYIIIHVNFVSITSDVAVVHFILLAHLQF